MMKFWTKRWTKPTRAQRVATLGTELVQLMYKEQLGGALEVARQLEMLDPQVPRWPHVQGDLSRRMGDCAKAAAYYVKATRLYAADGHDKRAAAMARTLLEVDHTRLDVLASVDPAQALRLRAIYSGHSASMRPRTHPMVLEAQEPC